MELLSLRLLDLLRQGKNVNLLVEIDMLLYNCPIQQVSYEVTMFSDVLEASRNDLEPGDNVVLTVDATIEGGQLKMLARSVQLVDKAILTGASAGLCVYVNEPDVFIVCCISFGTSQESS